MNKYRICRRCGKNLPTHSYPTKWCWICLRRLWEKEYDRYYVLNKKTGHWEEVQKLAGVFCDENNPKIIQEMENKEQEINLKNKINEFQKTN
jgi:hypothetical protein